MWDKGLSKGLWMQGRLPCWQDFQPVTVQTDQAISQNLWYTDGTTQGMMTHCPSSAYKTHVVGATMIMKDPTLVLKGMA
jgi:hypothetical protein